MADAKISDLSAGGGFAAGDFLPIDRGGVNYKATPIGVPVLVYRYTVTGSDKASIDTGADTADAGSNDWTNGDLLEIFLLARSDNAAAAANIAMTVNNTGGTSYDLQRVSGGATTVVASTSLGQAAWTLGIHGSGGTSGYASAYKLVFPDYAGTAFNKTGHISVNSVDGTAANNQVLEAAIGFRSTSALSRFAAAATSTDKLKVGSQLLIYKRLAS